MKAILLNQRCCYQGSYINAPTSGFQEVDLDHSKLHNCLFMNGGLAV